MKNLFTCALAIAALFLLCGVTFAQNTTCQIDPHANDSASWAVVAPGSLTVVTGSPASFTATYTAPTQLQGDLPVGGLYIFANLSQGSFAPADPNFTGAPIWPVATFANNSNPQVFTDCGKIRYYDVSVDTTGATPGTYTFTIHADAGSDSDADNGCGNSCTSDNDNDNAGKIGWGFGNAAQFTVIVNGPPTGPSCDPNDHLNVVINSPTAGNINFCNGGTSVPINIGASDSNNPITSLTATMNGNDITGSLSIGGIGTTSATGTGSFLASHVGGYALVANATTSCTENSAETDFGVVYVISGLQPPLASGSRPKGGSDAPIKIIPHDCNGALPPYDATIHIVILNSLGATLQDSSVGGCTGPKCGVGGDTTVRYDPTTGQYITNFQTDTGAGNKYTVNIYFDGFLNFTTTFTTAK